MVKYSSNLYSSSQGAFGAKEKSEEARWVRRQVRIYIHGKNEISFCLLIRKPNKQQNLELNLANRKNKD